jgi:predicted GH43/DUF377 family glycosyl hydrolase
MMVISGLFLLSSVQGQDMEQVFTLYSEEPVVAHSDNGAEWDGRYTDPGAIFYHDGQYHMFRNGFKAWPASVQIGYLTSPDGLNWTEVTEEPVLTTDEVSYARVAALAASVLVEDDGTWVLYFYIWDESSWPTSSGSIGRATASDPLRPWMPADAPILEPGSEGEWDELQVSRPTVVRTDDGYVMYYTGMNAEGSVSIGMATSEDGVIWTKYDDAVTSDAPYAESDPVFIAADEEDAWDSAGVYQPSVQLTPDGWVMLYKGVGANPRILPNGIATSEDGIVWTRLPENPVLTVDAVTGGRGLWQTELLYQDDIYFLYFELGKGGSTNIYVATHEGSLLE